MTGPTGASSGRAEGAPVPVTFYTREGCHLCEVAVVALDALAREFPIEVTAINIDLDLALLDRFNDIVPAIAVADELVTNAPIDLNAVRAAVRSAAETPRSVR